MTKAFAITLTITLSVSGILSCSKDGGSGSGSACSSNKAFAADVNPIIQAKCSIAGCHAPFSLNGPGPLTDYDKIAAAATSIRAAVSAGTMPQGSTLTAAQKNSIICWIDSGTPNN